MNVYAWIILVALLAEYGLNLATSALNLKALRTPLPVGFRDVLDAEAYRQSQAYTRAQTRFEWVRSTFQLAVLMVFWFAGGFEWLDTWMRSFGWGPVVTGVAYLGALGVAHGMLSLPFSVYSTFEIEERFGFNETSPQTFMLDWVKGTALGVVLGGPLLAAILWFFGATGPYGWVYAWLAVTAFSLILQYVAPRYVMPLFNDFEPLDEDELRTAILDYADTVDFAVDDVYVMDGSRRSSKSNAFFTGFGANRRIVLFDTLIEQHSVDELLTVVAHEIGHYKKKHIPQRMAISVVHTGVLFLLLSIFLQVEGLYDAFFVDQMSVYTGLLFFGLLYAPVELLLSIPMQMLSRAHEFEADRFAVRTTGRPQAFIDALKTLAANNFANLTPHPGYVLLHYSHPPMPVRLRAIRDAAPQSAEPAPVSA